jgi:dsDNA-specific endonuclease/ATPase MutS2
MPKVYLIHGLGTGRLREELHDMLRRHPRVRGFQNSHFPRYGFGATEVLLDH